MRMGEQDGPPPPLLPHGDTAETRRPRRGSTSAAHPLQRVRRGETSGPSLPKSRVGCSCRHSGAGSKPGPKAAAGARGAQGGAGPADRRCHPHLCAALRQGEPWAAGAAASDCVGSRRGSRSPRSLARSLARPSLVSDATGSRNLPPPRAPCNRTALRPAHLRGNPTHRPGAVPAGSQWAPCRIALLIG